MRCPPAWCLLLVLAVRPSSAEDWPRFRGGNGTGVSDQLDLPIELGPATADWSSEVVFGRSSPIVVGDTVFLTGADDRELVTLAVDAATGVSRWRRSVPRLRHDDVSDSTGPAVATPVSDGTTVYSFFPEFGVLAYSLSGEERWRHELPPFESYYGVGASPVIEGGVLVLVCDQQRNPFMVGIETGSGELLWRKERDVVAESWATPVVHHPGSDSATVITLGTFFVDGYAPRTGEHLWRLGGVGYAPVATPVVDGDRLYLNVADQAEYEMPSPSTFFAGDANADGLLVEEEITDPGWAGAFGWLDTDGDGSVSRSEYVALSEGMSSDDFGVVAVDLDASEGPKVLWRERKAVPYIASPILYRGVLFLVKDGGILTSFDPDTGEVLKRGRIEGAVEPFFPSPVASNGKLYFSSNDGTVAVVSAEAQWKTLAVSDLDEEIFASPAIAGGRLIIRTRTRLYSFSSKAD